MDGDGKGTVFVAEVEAELAKRQRMLDARERNIEIREQRLLAVTQTQPSRVVPEPAFEIAKVGRNDPCPCGSGVKYKRCHGG